MSRTNEIVEVLKEALKPYYKNKIIDKDGYKYVMRRAVETVSLRRYSIIVSKSCASNVRIKIVICKVEMIYSSMIKWIVVIKINFMSKYRPKSSDHYSRVLSHISQRNLDF